jgi:hypothetical protein
VKQKIKIVGKVDFVDRMISKYKNFAVSKESRTLTSPENDNKTKIFRLTDVDDINVVKITSGST